LCVEENTSPLGGAWSAFTCLRENMHGLQRERERLTSCYTFNKIKVSNVFRSADVSFDFLSHETDYLLNAHFREKKNVATLIKVKKVIGEIYLNQV